MDQTPVAPDGRGQAGRPGPPGSRRARQPDDAAAGPDSPDAAYPGIRPPAQWMLRVAARPGGNGGPPHDGGLAGQDPAEPAVSAQAVGATPARHGRPGGPGLGAMPPAGEGWPPPAEGDSVWQRLDRRWAGSGIAWARGPAHSGPVPVVAGSLPGHMTVPLGAPISAAPMTGPLPDESAVEVPPADLAAGWWGAQQAWEVVPDDPQPSPPAGGLLEPPAGVRRPAGGRRRVSRRTATVAVSAFALAAVAILMFGLLTGHGPKAGRLAADQQGNRAAAGAAPLTTAVYPGQQQRGVFQAIGRIAAYRTTIVAIGSQATDGVVRQQFFLSADGGASWRLAPVHAPGGGQPPLGYPAARVAGGPRGWLAAGPQATWTSPDGRSWTLAASRGITPMLPGDAMWVLNGTSGGFLAAGVAAGRNGTTQAVMWTSRDGLTWQRETAAQLGLAGPGETVRNIAYITARGDDTVISGTVSGGGTTYSAAWLSTNGGSAWTRVTVPAGHGAGSSITGLGFDSSGLIAIRPGRSASGAGDGVAYFSANGRDWQYAATIASASGWTPGLVKGSDYGFVVTGTSAAGQILAYTSSSTGTAWRPTPPLGNAADEDVAGATVGPGSAIIAVGTMAGSTVSQRPVFLEATAGGRVRQISLAAIPGAVVPESAVNGLAVAGGRQVAVGSADGYPAVWRRTAGGTWALATSLAQVSGYQRLRALTGVTRGSAGWLAVGTPGPVVFTSADGTTWRPAGGPGSITEKLAGVAAVATAAGPAGYVIVGKLVAAGGSCVADVWWSADLTSWTRGRDVNLAAGSSQVLSVAAAAHGFVSVGSHNGQPAAWTTTDGRSWKTIVMPPPDGTSHAALQQVAVNGKRVVALGQATTGTGPAIGSPTGTVPGAVPFAELSTDGGATWQQVPFSSPGPGTSFTALTADAGGFTAAGQSGPAGLQQAAIWTSANGTTWTPVPVRGLTGPQPGGTHRITALAPAGSAVTGIVSVATQQSQRTVAVAVPAR